MTGQGSDDRVLICAPIGRDASASAAILSRAGVPCEVCEDLERVVSKVTCGAAAVMMAEESLFGKNLEPLVAWTKSQPAWSDLPFLILSSQQEQPAITRWRQQLVLDLANVSFVERPVQTLTLTSAIKAATRARTRQYEVRDLLKAQQLAAESLESEVVARTAELARSNERLQKEMEDRARIEKSLRHSQKIEAIGQLTGGVAHDFNNLLMVISGGLEMMDRQRDPDRRKRLVDGMRQAAERGTGLTRQLLAFSRRQELRPEPIDLKEHIGGMKELLDRSLRGDVSVEMHLDPDLWPVEVDPAELELVILNLAVNSRDAMPDGGTIRIEARNVKEYPGESAVQEFVNIAVSDPGVGMTPEVKERVFEPFYTTKEVGRGSGLGLAQVYGFAKQSGGSVSIDSSPGVGTTVTLSLPRTLQSPRKRPEHLINFHQAKKAAGCQGSVLLVEDDDEVAVLVEEMLRQLGFQVMRVGSAKAALGALADARVVDVVFSDIMMPGGMNGLELAKQVHARHPDLPVLLTSAYAEAAIEAATSRGLQVLKKPYRLEELSAAITKARALPENIKIRS